MLLLRYGIDLAQFNKLWSKQGCVCGICKLPTKKSPHVDHDHDSGKVRGILCSSCNLGLGHFRDDPRRLRAAVKYLKEHGR